MPDNATYTQWEKLCEEHEAARAAYFQAFETVNQRFAAIYQGTSSTNPTNTELTEFDKAWKAWEDVKHRMSAFVKKHA